MTNESNGESIVGLARSAVRGLVELARLEVTRARQEIGEMVSQSLSGVIRIAIAVAMVLLALVALVVFLILGLAALTGLPGWLSALLVAIILMVIAGLLAWLGIRRIRIGPPEETIASVKEDVAWAKRLLRRE
jgi:uncharacterized membrane protein